MAGYSLEWGKGAKSEAHATTLHPEAKKPFTHWNLNLNSNSKPLKSDTKISKMWSPKAVIKLSEHKNILISGTYKPSNSQTLVKS